VAMWSSKKGGRNRASEHRRTNDLEYAAARLTCIDSGEWERQEHGARCHKGRIMPFSMNAGRRKEKGLASPIVPREWLWRFVFPVGPT
jgi:hypothetical protein